MSRFQSYGRSRAEAKREIQKILDDHEKNFANVAEMAGVTPQTVSATMNGMRHSPRVLGALRNLGIPERLVCDPRRDNTRMPRTENGQHEATGLSGAEHAKAMARAAIDAETSAAILAGFDYAVAGEPLHFRDTATACLMLTAGAAGLPESVDWNAYRADGELVRLTLTADEFLGLYAGGALAHKAACMAAGGAKKAALETGGGAA